MKNNFNYEEILKFVEDNNILNPGQLRIAEIRYYRQLYKRSLLEKVFPDYHIPTEEERLEKIFSYIKENGIVTRTQLQKNNPGAYTYLYQHKKLDEAFGETNRKGRKAKGNGLPFNPLLVDYFRRWASAENTTVEQQAKMYGYLPQYLEYIQNENNEKQ